MSTWQRYFVPLSQGIDSKTDEKQLPPGKLIELQNATFTAPGKLQKRNGLTSWDTTVVGSGSAIVSASSLIQYDDETLLFANNKLYTRLSNGWLYRTDSRNVRVTTDDVIRNTTTQRHPVMAVSGGYELYAWEDGRVDTSGLSVVKNNVRYSVVDSATRAVILHDQLASTSSYSPQCFAFTGSLFLAYCRYDSLASFPDRELVYHRFDPRTLTMSTATLVPLSGGLKDVAAASSRTDDLANGQCASWDFVPVRSGSEEKLFLVHGSPYATSGNSGYPSNAYWFPRIRVTQIVSQTLTYLTSTVPGGGLTGGGYRTSRGPVSAWTDPDSNVWWATVSGSFVTTIDGSTPLYGGVQSFAGATVMTESIIGYVHNWRGGSSNLAGISTTGSISSLYYELTGSVQQYVSATNSTEPLDTANINRFIGVATFGPSRMPTTGTFKRGMALASKPFKRGDTHYLWTLFNSDEQPTYFLVDANGEVVSKASTRLGGHARRNFVLPSVTETSTDLFRFPNQKRNSLRSENGRLVAVAGVATTQADFGTGSVRGAQLGNQLFIAGSVVRSYDRNAFVEHGFHVYPESLSASGTIITTAGTAGNFLSGTYQYRSVYQWVDNHGQVHRSPPSLPLTVTGPTNVTGSITVTIPTLRLTTKERFSPVTLELYRTEHGPGEVFYRVTQVGSQILYNTGSADTVTWRDTISDTTLISNDILYTDSNELDNDVPASCDLLVSWKGRIWLSGLEDPHAIRYSKVNAPTAFSDTFELSIDPAGGIITALAPMDDVLVVFKERSVHAVFPLTDSGTAYGGGPENDGSGGSFATQGIALGIGCVEPASVVTTDRGVFFKSAKGIYLLTRDRQLVYVGAPVERYNRLTITSATDIPSSNRIKFTTATETALVYDYMFEQWSVDTNHECVDSAVVGDAFALLRSDGTVTVETSGSYTDDGEHIPFRFTTGWLNLAEPQGRFRARSVEVLGDYRGAHKLKLGVAYDFNGSTVHSATIDARSAVENGNEGPLYQFSYFLKRQQATSLRVTVEDVVSGSANESCTVSHLAIEGKPKQGNAKLRSSRRGSTS